jgi:hypothetical protein
LRVATQEAEPDVQALRDALNRCKEGAMKIGRAMYQNAGGQQGEQQQHNHGQEGEQQQGGQDGQNK